jgi:hypothetical protein
MLFLKIEFKVQTNEPGTESKSPAFVQFDSSQPPAEEIALKYGPKPVERLPEVGVFRQTISKPVGFGAVGGTAFLNQKSLIATPVLNQFQTNIPVDRKLENNIILILNLNILSLFSKEFLSRIFAVNSDKCKCHLDTN